MARLSLRPDNQFLSSPIHSHKQTFLSVYTITTRSFPHHNPLKPRVKCSASGTERVRESKKLPKSPIKQDLPSLSFDSEVVSTETGFENNWPPWRNIPERYKLIGATSIAFVICNMDKVNLSIAIIPMSHQFGWSSSVAGLVQSSFFWGYALSQLPGGWLSKIFGGRKVLEIGVFTWSFATALVPLLAGFMPGLIFSRILRFVTPGGNRRRCFPIGCDRPYCQDDTCWGAVKGGRLCFWRIELGKCFGASLGSSHYPKL